jgi:imidazolonepropionase-like amidohydrolase
MEKLVLRCGGFLDPQTGDILRDQAVVVQRDRILQVLPADSLPANAGSTIDLGRYTVLPGLIDLHTHLASEAEFGHGYARMVQRTAAQEALVGVKHARDTLMAGFTTVRDVGPFRAFTDVALRDAIDARWFEGPRIACAGAFITVSQGGGDITGLAPDVDEVLPRELRFGIANSADEVRKVVREILARGADLIKLIATGAVLTAGTTPGAPSYTEAELRAGVEEAALYDAYVAAHAHGAEGIKRAVRAGVRTIEHGSLMDVEAIDLMAERGTYLVADVYNGDHIAEEGRRAGWSAEALRKNEETTEAQREGFAKAVDVGVRIAYGTDAGVYPHGNNARQFGYMVRHGMTPLNAIRSATTVAAEVLGWEDRVGSITEGRMADVIGVEGDPLEDVTILEGISFVMKGGVVVRGESATTPLRDRGERAQPDPRGSGADPQS